MKSQSNSQKFYQENGFRIVRRVFSSDECNHILREIKKFADKDFGIIINPDRPKFLLAQGLGNMPVESELWQKVDFVEMAFSTSKLMRGVMTDPRLVSVLEEIQGREVIALVSQFFFKEAGSYYAKQAWNPHQDNSYLHIKKGCAINAQLILADADPKNGSVYVFPGSHKEDILPFEPTISYGKRAKNRPGNKCVIPEKYSRQDLHFKKGDFFILDGNLIHGSYPNNSNRSRPVYAWQTCTRDSASPALESRGKNAQRMEITLRRESTGRI